MALLDLLQSVLGSMSNDVAPVTVNPPASGGSATVNPNVQSSVGSTSLAAPPAQNMNLADPPSFNPPTDASQDKQPLNLNYNNSQQAGAVNNALSGEPTPRGGSANPGIYGLLPPSMQHGTLRNILGALGDAFLVGHGDAAQYGPRMQRQEVGQALAGYSPDDPQSIQAAIQRVAATGAPGSTEMADQMQKNATEAALRKQMQEQNAWYHQSTVESRQDNTIQRMTPTVANWGGQAKTAADYQAAYDRAEAVAQRVDPRYHATDFGYVEPGEWQPGSMSGVGMTANNSQVSSDKGAQRQVSMRNTDVNAASRVQAAGVSGGAHIGAATIGANRTTDATILQGMIAKQNSGQTLTPSEQAWFNHATQISRGGGRALPAGLVPHTSQAPAHPQQQQQFQEGKVYQDAHGNRARYTNGTWTPVH